MPIYEYQCTSCGHRFEFFRSIKDAPLTVCPNCQGALKKLMSPAGLIFKGSGWYKTDSRTTPSETTSGEQASANGDKKSEAAAGASDTAKTGSESASATSGESSKPSKPTESKSGSGTTTAD